MKNFPKNLVFLLLLSLIISCKKSDNSKPKEATGYFMSFKANGTYYKFNNSRTIARLFNGNLSSDGVNKTPFYQVNIAGYGDKTEAFPGLIVGIKSPNKIQAIKYSSTPTDQFRGVPSLELQCNLPITDLYVKSKTYGGYQDITLTLTEITIDYVKGTFSGSAYSVDGKSEKVSITEGEFYLERVD